MSAVADLRSLSVHQRPEPRARVLDRGMGVELRDHLCYDKGDPAGRGSPNSRNGSTPKTLATEVGSVPVATPRDRAGTFEPRLSTPPEYLTPRAEGIPPVTLTSRRSRQGSNQVRLSSTAGVAVTSRTQSTPLRSKPSFSKYPGGRPAAPLTTTR